MALAREHHVLLQAIMSKGPIPEDDARKIHSEMTGKESDLHFHAFLSDINKRLHELQLELRGSVDQGTGTIFYGVVNQLGDDQSKLGTTLSSAENSYFRAVVEKVAQYSEGAGHIPTCEALLVKAGSATQSSPGLDGAEDSQQGVAKQLSNLEKERALSQLVAQQWLSKHSEDSISLGVRSFLELKGYLKSLDSVTTCTVCNEAAIMAENCRKGCGVRLHPSCVKRRCRNNSVNFVCPNPDCQADWHVAPSAVPASGQPKRKQVKRTLRAKR